MDMQDDKLSQQYKPCKSCKVELLHSNLHCRDTCHEQYSYTHWIQRLCMSIHDSQSSNSVIRWGYNLWDIIKHSWLGCLRIYIPSSTIDCSSGSGIACGVLHCKNIWVTSTIFCHLSCMPVVYVTRYQLQRMLLI